MELKCLPDKRLSDAERAVVEYINKNKQKSIIRLLSISDISEGAFVSNATVSRAIRKCGFSSLSEMKFRLEEETKGDPQTYEMNRILSKSYTECVETVKRIDIPSVIDIAGELKRAKVVYLLANGLTALIAEEFAVQLQCQKINVCLISDSEMMRKTDLLAGKGDVVLILSVKNSTPELAIGARLGKKMGAKVITLCCTEGTELDGISDLLLYGYTQSIHSNRSFGGTSRLGLLIMTRTIVEYLTSDAEG
ncbi:MAG: MurR/RpiR family transcriptional regulator [Clostridia bacterium]|nr:MurR/RpiR family transcriptional regulator [Clostridia bacterium]